MRVRLNGDLCKDGVIDFVSDMVRGMEIELWEWFEPVDDMAKASFDVGYTEGADDLYNPGIPAVPELFKGRVRADAYMKSILGHLEGMDGVEVECIRELCAEYLGKCSEKPNSCDHEWGRDGYCVKCYALMSVFKQQREVVGKGGDGSGIHKPLYEWYEPKEQDARYLKSRVNVYRNRADIIRLYNILNNIEERLKQQ